MQQMGKKRGISLAGVFFFSYLCSMKLSIVVPVYQVVGTLERCVGSILEQSFRDYQLILVDDASPDGSGALCDDLARRDGRIVVIHRQRNGGLSAARNSGIAKAKGEYVTFVDSDDFLGADVLKGLMGLLVVHHDWDILEYSMYVHWGGGGRMSTLRLEDREYRDMREYWYGGRAYMHTYACNKIFRRQLFEGGLRFAEGRKFEDVWLMPQLLQRCSVVATTRLGYYYYCYNAGGITAQATGQDLQDLLDAHMQVLNAGEDSLLGQPTAAYYEQVLNVALDVYEKSGEVPVLPGAKELGVGSGELGVGSVKMRLLKIIGLKNLCRINKFAHKIYRRSR